MCYLSFFFFFNDTPPPEISTLPLHSALPISCAARSPSSYAKLPATPTPPRIPLVYERSPSCRLSHPSDRKSTRLNSSHANISYAVFCLKKKKKRYHIKLYTLLR